MTEGIRFALVPAVGLARTNKIGRGSTEPGPKDAWADRIVAVLLAGSLSIVAVVVAFNAFTTVGTRASVNSNVRGMPLVMGMDVPAPARTHGGLGPLDVIPVPRATAARPPSGETEEAFNKRIRPSLAALPQAERAAIGQFTHGDAISVRAAEVFSPIELLDRGWSGDRLKAVVEEGGAVESAIAKLSAEPGTVYRGLSDMGLADAARFLRSREIQLGPEGRGATTVVTWDPHTALERYLGSDPPINDPNPDVYKALLVIKGKSAVPIAPLSGFKFERDMLFAKDARFKVTNVGQAGPAGSGLDRVLVVQLDELGPIAR